MPLDHYVTLGKSGLRVSPFCLGTMTFGEDWGWGASVEESLRVLDGYLDRGGNFLDTANYYTKGHSEKIIGDHIGRNPSRRDRVVIATKFYGNMYPGDPNGGGSSSKSIQSPGSPSSRTILHPSRSQTGRASSASALVPICINRFCFLLPCSGNMLCI